MRRQLAAPESSAGGIATGCAGTRLICHWGLVVDEAGLLMANTAPAGPDRHPRPTGFYTPSCPGETERRALQALKTGVLTKNRLPDLQFPTLDVLSPCMNAPYLTTYRPSRSRSFVKKQSKNVCQALCAAAGLLAAISPARAQTGPTPQPSIAPVAERFVPVTVDSGLRPAPGGNVEDAAQVIYSTRIFEPNASIIRLKFGTVDLAGDPSLESGVILRLTSTLTGEVQILTGLSAVQWRNTSAYFNGPQVEIELLARPGVAASRITVEGVWVDEPVLSPQDICGGVDDRMLSTDRRVARTSNGCTAWLINDTNGGLLTAGHCTPSTISVVSFNVPLSTNTGSYAAASPDDQYSVDTASAQSESSGVGRDYGYFGASVNSNHGLLPAQRSGGTFNVISAPVPSGQTIRITGHGSTNLPISNTWNGVQKTHSGPYGSLSGSTVRYFTDTTGGNSGSPIIINGTSNAIGIHTHAGCSGGGNQGTAAQYAPLRAALAAPRGISRTGKGLPGGDLFAIGDAANNFGTLRIAPDNFARITANGARWQGLTWNPTEGVFYAINAVGELNTVSPSGTFSLISRVAGTTLSLTGLAFDSLRGELYAVAPTNGQLFKLVNSASPVAVAVGSPEGGNIRALEYDATRDVLWSVGNTGSGAQLCQIGMNDGARTIIGPLGLGITTVPDIAVNQVTGELFAINPDTEQLVRMNPVTGEATTVGNTGALWGTTFGLSYRNSPPTCAADLTDGSTGGPDGVVDGSDFIAFINAFAGSEPLADIDRDLTVDGTDFVLFINAFAGGC